jgi:hypothetical protein
MSPASIELLYGVDCTRHKHNLALVQGYGLDRSNNSIYENNVNKSISNL